MRREEKYPDQKCLNISSSQTDYLNLDNSLSGSSRHSEKANSAKAKCTYCGLNNHSVEKCFKKIRKEKAKARSAGTSLNKNSDLPARKCLRCGSEDHMIAKFPKPPKDSEKRGKSEKSKEKGNRTCNNSDDDDELKVYAYMEQMSNDDKRENKDYGDSSQLINWILDSGATCYMTPKVTDFIPGSLEDTDKLIEVADGHHVT